MSQQHIKISTQKLGKRFVRDWIFRNLDIELSPGEPVAVTGPNGSGKSTLLQMLAGYVHPTEGKVTYTLNNKGLEVENLFSLVSIATPYMELIEEFTLNELLDFHLSFKQFQQGITKNNFAERIHISNSVGKPIRLYSSGMKQRVKLGLAMFSDTPLLLLDEPTANLDIAGSDWYKSEILKQTAERTVLVCSNIPSEFDFCKHVIRITDYKSI